MSSYALQQSTFFEEARIKAKIPFLHHQVLECDSSGREFNIIKHDIAVEIPKGAVSEGEKLCLEVGVASSSLQSTPSLYLPSSGFAF